MKGKIDGARAKGLKTILIFGENDNDCHALKYLVEALRPGVARIQTRRQPIILGKGAKEGKRDGVCREMERLVAAQNVVGEVVSVIAHRDCDEIEPAHENCRNSLLDDMRRMHALPQPVAATPAFEMEAWWFLWPQAVAETRPCWNALSPRGHVGKIANAKEELRRTLRPKGAGTRCPDYAESDSRKIAENVKRLGVARASQGKSDSFADFVDQIDKLKV